MHLFLSPHLDDVMLSCGGAIARLRRQGEKIVILTAMAGEPQADMPDTPVVRALRGHFRGINAAIITRRKEDAQAALCLDVKAYHLALVESAFRAAQAPDGPLALYPSDESQYGDVHPADEVRVALLTMPLPFNEKIHALYAPLAAGNHVDHQLVRDWALVLAGAHGPNILKFYGEYPYVLNEGALAQALAYFDNALLGMRLHPEQIALEDDEVEAKMTALRCYASRIPVVWETLHQMEQTVREWMLSTGNGMPAEQFWSVVKQTGPLEPQED